MKIFRYIQQLIGIQFINFYKRYVYNQQFIYYNLEYFYKLLTKLHYYYFKIID